MGFEMRDRMAGLQQRWERPVTGTRFQFGIGIATGLRDGGRHRFAGAERLHGAQATRVNLAIEARRPGRGRPDPGLPSERWQMLLDIAEATPIDEISLKGRQPGQSSSTSSRPVPRRDRDSCTAIELAPARLQERSASSRDEVCHGEPSTRSPEDPRVSTQDGARPWLHGSQRVARTSPACARVGYQPDRGDLRR
jgi:hypothetical protein